ncbi:MAG: hypothetical protein ACRD1R_15100 [Acidobacteriota bacterium]
MRTSAIESSGLYPQTKRPDPSLRNLALGILLQAFRDIVAPKKNANQEWKFWRQDAVEWFYSDAKGPGSFMWVCELLEMNSRELREWLHAYKHSNQSRKKEMARKLTRFQIRH